MRPSIRPGRIFGVDIGVHYSIGSTTDRLLRRTATPLLIIDDGKAKRSIPPNIRRIVVTTDFSVGGEDALTYGLSLDPIQVPFAYLL